MTDLTEVLGRSPQEAGDTNADVEPAAPLTVTSEDLENLWSALMPDSYAARRGLDAFLETVQAGAGQSPDADLHFRPGGWQVDLGRGVVQSIVGAGIIAGLLAALGATAIPAALVTAVVPLFFDVKRVSLTPGEEYLIADLVAHKDALDGSLTSRELYDRLDGEARQQLSFMDFTDFLDTCRRAGLADNGAAGKITLRPVEAARFRITFA